MGFLKKICQVPTENKVVPFSSRYQKTVILAIGSQGSTVDIQL